MIRRLALLALSVVLNASCSHAKPEPEKVEPTPAARTAAKAAPRKDDTTGGTDAKHPKPPTAAESGSSGPPVASSPSELLMPGAGAKIQEALKNRGFLNGAVDGELDDETAAAVRKFQAKEGLARTGLADHETLRRLGLDPREIYRRAKTADDGAGSE